MHMPVLRLPLKDDVPSGLRPLEKSLEAFFGALSASDDTSLSPEIRAQAAFDAGCNVPSATLTNCVKYGKPVQSP